MLSFFTYKKGYPTTLFCTPLTKCIEYRLGEGFEPAVVYGFFANFAFGLHAYYHVEKPTKIGPSQVFTCTLGNNTYTHLLKVKTLLSEVKDMHPELFHG